MRSSPRLSLFAILSGLVLASMPAEAGSRTYILKSEQTALTEEGWEFNMASANAGLYFNNSDSQNFHYLYSGALPGVVTNISFYGHRTKTCTRTILFTAGSYSETITAKIVLPNDNTATTDVTFYTHEFSEEDEVTSFRLKCTGGSNNFYFLRVTIHWIDPPPTIDPIDTQTVGSLNDLLVHFTATSFDGDALTFSVTAENLTNPGMTIPSSSWSVDYNYSMMRPGYYDFTFDPPDGIAPCQIRFTITATGSGGSASQSFVCEVTEGAVPTPPQINSPWYSPPSVLAGRTISGQVECYEADGDKVNFSLVSKTSQGEFLIDPDSGEFSFTPTPQDVGDSPQVHVFTVRATDKDDSNDANISIVVLPVSLPVLAPIDNQTVLCGEIFQIDLVAESTDVSEVDGHYIYDPLLSSNITVKAGTTAPEGECIFEDGYLSFTPTTNDIGQTFIFTASATDLDGTTNQDFNVTVGLAAPVLKHCPVDQWTPTSFTADIEAAVPGAISYRLRHIHTEANGTVVTGYVDNATFPCVVSGLDTTNYVYAVQAQRGATVSSWSNAKSIDLHNYIAPTYAIPMTGAARGVYRQNFNSLITSGSIYWYDARTIPGWYAASSSGSMSDGKLTASKGVSSEIGILSCQVDTNNIPNRALGLRADTQWDDFSFGAVFTNKCKYAVTNLTVTFTALQIRRYTTISKLHFSYARSNGFIELITSGLTWTDIEALRFTSPIQGSSAQLYPPATERLSASIPFEGANAIQPGEVIAMRWYLEAKNNYPTLAIDDLEVKWQCDWPRHTVIYLR